MSKVFSKPVTLSQESLNKSNKRLATFSISRTGPNPIVSIVGYFHLKPILGSIRFARGSISVGSKHHIVYDMQAMDGKPPKKITEETCIVLLNEDQNLCQKISTIIVDDTTELLSFLDEENENLIALEV